MTKISIPELALVVLIGPTGSGKSTFARRYFKPTEIISSDFCRGLVSDDENDQTVTKEAFDLLQTIVAKRLANGRLTVVDATNVQPDSRKPYIALAREYHCLPVAIVLNMPERICIERDRQRADRNLGSRVIQLHKRQLNQSLGYLKKEGFRFIYQLNSPEEADHVEIERNPLWSNKKHEHGPFDIIGDVHGCCFELENLLGVLGYREKTGELTGEPTFSHPQGRRVIFLGDIVDRGPRILDAYRLVRRMIEEKQAFCVPGNHDMKLYRLLQGKQVQIKHGLEKTLAELESLPDELRDRTKQEMADFFYGLTSHLVLDDGRLVVAHAGMKEEMQGRGSGKVRDFALYGETTGESDEFGLPVRYNWAADYRGKAMVVYGHTPNPEPEWINRTINIDTGCVFGGRLTALRYPEKELVTVPAGRVYCPPVKPIDTIDLPGQTLDSRKDDLLQIQDVQGKRIISTRLRSNITIREENANAALEVMSRYAVDPRWIIYLPPTMSPSETSRRPDLLEHPAEAFDYYRGQNVPIVICEQKHMGSRAVVIVCRDEEVSKTRFGMGNGGIGICYTRTGRRFFEDPELESEFLGRVHESMSKQDWWNKFDTNWFCLDCELMPWSAKAQELIRQQYAAVASAANNSLAQAVAALEQIPAGDPDASAVLERFRERKEMVGQYKRAFGHYCWPVDSLNDLKLAPFHLLASEGKVYTGHDHLWHMETVSELVGEANDLLLATPFRQVDLLDLDSVNAAVDWWEALTSGGGEGMVVKPLDLIANGKRGPVQPAIKCRGKEYLRIIYGPEYTLPEHLDRLRSRSLNKKRSLAMREFALGIEALERFVKGEPLYRVHECVFGILALESDPVDPRL